MKNITQPQLQHIDQFLMEHYRLYYIDIRAEVVDHMANDIEEQLQDKTYEEAFVHVIAKWDATLKPSKFFFRGIPRFIAQQWTKERIKRGAKACLLGALTTLIIASFFSRFIDLDTAFPLGLGTLLILYVGIGILYIINRSLVREIPLHTATGTFLRVEFKRLGWVQSVFIIMPLLGQMKFISVGELFVYTYFLIGFVMLFYLVQWRMDYQKEQLYQIKWKSV